jgi:hypothetical protein
MFDMSEKLQQPKTRKMEGAYRKVCEFWWAHGMRLESENGSDTFKYELVQKMGGLHGEVGLMDQVSVDEFNRYLTAWRLLEILSQPCG